MKKLCIVIILIFIFGLSFAQKNVTIFVYEIDTTKDCLGVATIYKNDMPGVIISKNNKDITLSDFYGKAIISNITDTIPFTLEIRFMCKIAQSITILPSKDTTIFIELIDDKNFVFESDPFIEHKFVFSIFTSPDLKNTPFNIGSEIYFSKLKSNLGFSYSTNNIKNRNYSFWAQYGLSKPFLNKITYIYSRIIILDNNINILRHILNINFGCDDYFI